MSLASDTRFVQQRLFSEFNLPLGTYTLTINNVGNGLNVDAFVVTLTTITQGPGRISSAGGWNLVQRGMSGVSAMQLVIVSPTQALIFDKVEHNYASASGRPAWSVLYDINTDEIQPFSLLSNSFCAAGSFLSNGTLVSIGGNPAAIVDSDPNEYHDDNGLQSIRIFEPCLGDDTSSCTVLDMVNASKVERWYPTVLRVMDGSALVIGGGTANVFMNNHTINQPSVSFFPSKPTSPIKFDFDFLNRTLNANLFVQAFSLPNKRAFVISNTKSIFYNWGANPPFEENNTVSDLPNGIRVTYPMPGTSMLLPLSAADNYTSRIIVCGGSDAPDTLCDFQYSSQHTASSQCSRIEIKRDGTTTGWVVDDPLPEARVMPDSVLLPTGEVVFVNGAGTGYSGFGSTFNPIGESNADVPALSPAVYSGDKPAGQRFTSLGVRTDIPRMYHSVATLTPNGDVMITGSNPNADRILRKYQTEYRVEWLRPPYMNSPRPSYKGLPLVIGYGTLFRLEVEVPEASSNTSDIKGKKDPVRYVTVLLIHTFQWRSWIWDSQRILCMLILVLCTLSLLPPPTLSLSLPHPTLESTLPVQDTSSSSTMVSLARRRTRSSAMENPRSPTDRNANAI